MADLQALERALLDCVNDKNLALSHQRKTVKLVQAMADLQALAGILLDSVNDKNLALSYLWKTNKYRQWLTYRPWQGHC